MIHKIFIASSNKSRSWAGDFQEYLDLITNDEFEFKIWDQDIFQPSSFILNNLIREAELCNAAIFLFAPDDEIVIHDQSFSITRDNVIFELGLFTGYLGLERVIIITPAKNENFRLLSDTNGLVTIKFSYKPHNDNNRISSIGPVANKIKRYLEKVLSNDYLINVSTLKSVGLAKVTFTTDFSALSYVDAINASNIQYRLLGVGADKVTSNKEEFDNMLERIIENRGKVRLLMLDPNCYSMVASPRNKKDIENLRVRVRRSLTRISESILLFNCVNRIEIRSYFSLNHDHMPPFRLTFVNNDFCIVSPRSFSEKDKSEVQPQLVFNRKTFGQLPGYYGAFNNLFESIWLQSTQETVETMLSKIDQYPKQTAPFGCVHGRFQPPHLGHLNYILKAKAKCDLLYIGITQPDNKALADCHTDPHRAELKNNPLTFSERQEALRAMLNENGLIERRDYVIIPYDIDSPELLKRYIHSNWMQFTTLIDAWNVLKNARLKKLGYEVVSVADKREDASISGTVIRTLARENNRKYEIMISKSVAKFLDKIGFEERLNKT